MAMGSGARMAGGGRGGSLERHLPSIEGAGWGATHGYSHRWKGAAVTGARMSGTDVEVPRNGTFHRWKGGWGATRVYSHRRRAGMGARKVAATSEIFWSGATESGVGARMAAVSV